MATLPEALQLLAPSAGPAGAAPHGVCTPTARAAASRAPACGALSATPMRRQRCCRRSVTFLLLGFSLSLDRMLDVMVRFAVTMLDAIGVSCAE